MLWEPLVALLPVHPPLAVQLVALVLLQVRVDDWPGVILAGDAPRFTVGADGSVATLTVADCCVVSPAPVQESV